jgi:DNA invertase Pin-like site-specific DNA recombinase
MVETATPRTAGIYARVSADRRKQERSVDEQEVEARRVCADAGWSIAEVYREDPISASRFSGKDRPEWARLLADMTTGRFDVLVLWESSRGDRTPESWLGMLSTARDKGTAVHVVSHERTYDPRVPRDWKALADDGLDSAYESEKTSLRVRRTKAASAVAGRPDGRPPFGYRRRYDSTTGALLGQEPDPETAPVVREIFRQFVAGTPILEIVRVLKVTRAIVTTTLHNPAHIAHRRHNGDSYPADWEPLVDEATFYAVQRILSDPARRRTRPGRTTHLLSYLATCGACGAHLSVRYIPTRAADRTTNQGRSRPIYVCKAGSHAAIREDWLDRFVSELVVARLSRPDIYPALTAADDTAVVAARGEAEALRARMEEFIDSAAKGELSAVALARVEARLLPQIADAEKRATLAATPPVLRQLLEPRADVAERWAGLPIAARKDVVRVLIDAIRVHPTSLGRTSSYNAIDERRVEVEWRSS